MIKVKMGLTPNSRRHIRNFPREFQDALKPAFEKIMLKAEARSKEKYFKTGSLHSSPDSKIVTTRSGSLQRIIKSEVKDQGNQIYAALVADIEYASTHEYGDSSRNIGDRPFLTPAIKDTIDDVSVESIIVDEINKRINWRT